MPPNFVVQKVFGFVSVLVLVSVGKCVDLLLRSNVMHVLSGFRVKIYSAVFSRFQNSQSCNYRRMNILLYGHRIDVGGSLFISRGAEQQQHYRLC